MEKDELKEQYRFEVYPEESCNSAIMERVIHILYNFILAL